ncbi:glycosyltransferase [Candidatus Gracilibacteria bacterium]|nr:glycosyltransferase [Candidatus Gracilibacteria bacterium]
MKIKIVFLGKYNNKGIGGGDRKYNILYENLNVNFFEKYFIYITDKKKLISIESKNYVLTSDMILDFLFENNIDYVYFAGADILNDIKENIIKNFVCLINVNFVHCYLKNPNVLNLIISKTEHFKLMSIHSNLINSYVVYNPINFDLWTKLSESTDHSYRSKLSNKKFIIGRIARSEPSKWSFLIISTLFELQFKKNYKYGFIFVGMPLLYRFFLKIFLNKIMYNSIIFLPEQKEYSEIAKFYKSIDIFWQTSGVGESFGNVIAESFCFKIPVFSDYKIFYNNGKVKKNLYDAQIELVDNNINGFYLNTPKSIISKLDSLSKHKIDVLGKNGYSKVKNIYNVKVGVNTLAKILYDYGRINLGYEKDDNFEQIVKIPGKNEINEYKYEYLKRIEICNKNNKINFSYFLLKTLWEFVEFLYLLLRKILIKFFSFNLEKIY